MSRPKKYNPQYHDNWGWSLAAKGATDEQIATAFGISVRTLQRWKFQTDTIGNPVLDKFGNKKLSTFGEAVQVGKQAADADVEKSLYKRATGFRTTDIRKVIQTDPKTGQATVNRTEITEKEIPPDTMAMMYWLNNRFKKSNEWSQTQRIDVTTNERDFEALDEVMKKGKK